MESGVWEKEWEIPWMHAHLCWDNLGLFTCVLKYRKGTVHYVYGKLQQSRTACPCVSISPRVGTWKHSDKKKERNSENNLKSLPFKVRWQCGEVYLFMCVSKWRKWTWECIHIKLQQSRTMCACVSLSLLWVGEQRPEKNSNKKRKWKRRKSVMLFKACFSYPHFSPYPAECHM